MPDVEFLDGCSQQMGTILAGLAQMERKLVGERTREAMCQIGREGRVRSGRLPFGYRTKANPTSLRAVAGDRSPLVEHAEEQHCSCSSSNSGRVVWVRDGSRER